MSTFECSAIIPDVTEVTYSGEGLVSLVVHDVDEHKGSHEQVTVMLFPRLVPDMIRSLADTLSVEDRKTLIAELVQSL